MQATDAGKTVSHRLEGATGSISVRLSQDVGRESSTYYYIDDALVRLGNRIGVKRQLATEHLKDRDSQTPVVDQEAIRSGTLETTALLFRRIREVVSLALVIAICLCLMLHARFVSRKYLWRDLS